jgi:hypothetical protein
MSSYRVVHRGSLEEDQDGDIQFPMAKIPLAKDGGTNDLMTAIVLLNMGKFDSEKDYAAFFYWDAVEKHVLLYRNPKQPWDTHHIELLEKSRDDSLDYLDNSKEVHQKILNLIGLNSGTKLKRNPKRKTREKKQKRKSKSHKSKKSHSK